MKGERRNLYCTVYSKVLYAVHCELQGTEKADTRTLQATLQHLFKQNARTHQMALKACLLPLHGEHAWSRHHQLP